MSSRLVETSPRITRAPSSDNVASIALFFLSMWYQSHFHSFWPVFASLKAVLDQDQSNSITNASPHDDAPGEFRPYTANSSPYEHGLRRMLPGPQAKC